MKYLIAILYVLLFTWVYVQLSGDHVIDEETSQRIEENRSVNAYQQQKRSYIITIMFQQTGITLLLFAVPFMFVLYQNRRVWKRVSARIKAFESWYYLPVRERTEFSSFTQKLLKANPDLTARELELCTLLRQNFDSKSIARRFNISPASVYTARYRLRKKLDINTDKDLVAYLLQFVEK